MNIKYSETFHRAPLPKIDKERCYAAIERFKDSPKHPGLNYERIGKGRQNHCSIRASQELRVILAVEPDFQNPENVILANMGHHDAMYAWSERQGFHSDTAGADFPVEESHGDLSETLSAMANFDYWQIYLQPDQRPLVTRQYPGEARIRGAAGTGKTVVALHRAAELGKRFADQKMLVTTFSRSLTEHLQHLFRGLPDAPPNVEFINIDRLARRLADGPHINSRKIDQAFEEARCDVLPGTSLEACGDRYLRDEVEKVIKGRAATREEYLSTDSFQRLGRHRRFTRADREVCWRLRERWDEEMREAGTVSFADVLIDARNRVEKRGAACYRAAIVDEAQDMTLVGMQLVRALVAGAPTNPVPPDALFMVDDAAQRIYAGGFHLRWAGIRVSGRSEILGRNYRNARPIVEAAKAIRGDKLPVRDDNDDGAALHASYARENGPRPVLLRVGEKGELPAIKREIQRLTQEEKLEYRTIAVLTRTNPDADAINTTLERWWNIPCTPLKDLRQGKFGTGVRVGTFDRSKGLDFRAVIIPRLGASIFPKNESGEDQLILPGMGDAGDDMTDEEREARQLDLDRLYVGMTRAMEWLLLVADESPCGEIDETVDMGLLQPHPHG
ncbi:MAG: AAA family ATPase [Gammaproteobacteria bacterium]|nr:AAA family ATPase [Gammaproteobacteria bacterium]